MSLKIVCVSDTHCRLDEVTIPDGDLLVHAGDLTFQGTVKEISRELTYLGKATKRFKHGCIFVPGNHDWLFQTNMSLAKQMCEDYGITVLHHTSTQIEGLNIFGSAYTPAFMDWAFNKDRAELKEVWDEIPDNTNILISHGPPMGILSTVRVVERGVEGIDECGCYDLYNRIQELKDLKLHIFGHIHDSYGTIDIGNITHINASICTENYKPINKPIIIDL